MPGFAQPALPKDCNLLEYLTESLELLFQIVNFFAEFLTLAFQSNNRVVLVARVGPGRRWSTGHTGAFDISGEQVHIACFFGSRLAGWDLHYRWFTLHQALQR